jgi:hypothetical protein
MTTDAPLFPFCVPLPELRELGPGIPLYYWFLKFLILAALVILVIAGALCTYDNYHADHARDWSRHAGFIIKLSLGN